jgi:hypothetical protein
MANDFSSGQWVIDTVMPTAYKAQVKISNIVWTDQVAAGDQLVILNRAGKTVLDIKAQAANIVQTLGGFGWVDGFQITVLSSGKVFVYMAGK